MLIIKSPKHLNLLVILACVGLARVVVPNAIAEPLPNTISMTVKHADIAELYEMLSKQHQANILLSPGVEGNVSVNLYNVSLQEAVYSIATAAGFVVENKNNAYIISKVTEAGKTIAGGLKQIRTYKIQYSDAVKVADIVKKYLSPYGRADVLLDRKVIVIEDIPDFVRQAEQLIEQLDRAPAQILIEAQILDIKLDDKRALGVDWKKTTGDIKVGAQDFAAVASGGMFFTLMNKNIEVTLNALSERNKVTVLSTPKLLALEHESAEVMVGARTGYKTILAVPNGGGQLEQIQFLESGVILRVTPYVDRFGGIMMKIHPEVSTASLSNNIPSLATTEVTTRVLVEDGQMVFIGGLIKNNMINNHNGIPFLEDIPFIGRLFAGSNEEAGNTETVVLIKPQVIRPRSMPLITEQAKDVQKFENEVGRKTDRIEQFFKKKSDLWELPVRPR
jgi:type II secretory pathway component GspD/PulD (secretin)